MMSYGVLFMCTADNPADAGSQKGFFNILIVDDTPMNLSLASKLLRRRGHQVVEADSGESAVEHFRRGETCFDVILMDLRMPGMDGLEATRLIRQHESDLTRRDGKNHHTPIIALTANDEADERENCRSAGMDGFITKPLDIKTVDNTIREIHQQAVGN